MIARSWLVMMLVALLGGSAGAAESQSPVVRAALFADTAVIEAGKPFTLAMVITPPPEWHIYWKNPGDAGDATRFKFIVPAGFRADEPQFPIPTKFSQAGDIVAYGYTGPTVFLARITPPKDWAAGKAVTLGVNCAWLCCKDVCIPGAAKLTLTIPAGAAPGNGEPGGKEWFDKVRAAIPAPAAPAGIVSSIAVNPAQDAKVARISTGLNIHWNKEVRAVEFFPLALDGLEVSDIKIDTQKDQTHVSLHARVLEGAKLHANRLPVLIAYTDAGGARHGFYTDIDLHVLAAGVTP